MELARAGTPDLPPRHRPGRHGPRRRTRSAVVTEPRAGTAGSGQWRRQIIDAHPDTASLRYLAAPVVTAAICVGTLLGLAGLLGLVLGAPAAWLIAGVV